MTQPEFGESVLSVAAVDHLPGRASPVPGVDGYSEGSVAVRYVWQCRFGSMVIEVRDGLPYVNGEKVEPMEAR